MRGSLSRACGLRIPLEEVAASFLDQLCAQPEDSAVLPPTALVAAHADDEVIGAGSRLSRMAGALTIIQVTDGSPRDLRDARAQGFATQEDYARARRKEFESALRRVGLAPERMFHFNIADQEASLNLLYLVRELAAAIYALHPAVIITHPYEGGHPDHDATAFAVHAVCRLLGEETIRVPAIIEMTSYHNRDGRLTPFEFLPGDDRGVRAVSLTPEQQHFKRSLLDCYATQRQTLQYFPLEVERFRPAPAYDFLQPPHPGVLFYEMFDWGMTGARWRELAAETLRELGMDGPI